MKRIAIWTPVMLAIVSICLIVLIHLMNAPEIEDSSIVILDSEMEPLGTVYSEGDRIWQSLDAIHPLLVEATIAVEDQNFYHHAGFDLKRISAAVIENLRRGNFAQGASTISQQYARNLFLTHEKTWTRKIQEAIFTIRLEHHFDKDELLEGYLNTIYYGHGIYGVEAASVFYFGKPTNDLTLAEIALLVAIPNRPNANSPIRHFERAEQQQEKVLAILRNDQIISETEKNLAKSQVLTIAGEKLNHPQFGYIADLAIKEAEDILGRSLPNGAQLKTTINHAHQTALYESVLNNIETLQVGAIMAHPATGAISALIGGTDYDESPFNRATQANRMVGSTFKPFIYYTALENGFTAATPLMSEPTVFTFSDRDHYTPGNFRHQYANDSVTLARALAVSDNIYAVKTHLFLTPEKVIDYTRQIGVTSELEPVPALALGTASLSVIEVLTAYSHFANGGHAVKPFLLEKILTSDGEVLFEREPGLGERVLNEQNTFILNKLMTGMFDPNLSDYLAVTGGSISESLNGDYAGKSGSTDFDSWMVGYSPELITAVWTGFDDNKPISGKTQAAKLIWRDAMEAGLKERESQNFVAPPGIVAAYVDPKTGLLSGESCPVSRLMFFVEGTEPVHYCHVHGE